GNRVGTDGRDLPARGRDHPDLLAIGHDLRNRGGARSARVGSSPHGTLSSLPNQRRLDRGRRSQSIQLVALGGGAGSARTRQGSAFPRQRAAYGPPEGARGGAQSPLSHQKLQRLAGLPREGRTTGWSGL